MMANMEIKVGDKFRFHSDNGINCTIYVVNINNFREPSMRYGLDVDDFISRCKEISDNIINKLSNMTVKNILDNKSDVCYNNNCKIVKFEKRKR